MQDRDLIVGVLAAQAGFVTPSEVLTAAAAGLIDAKSESLLARLEREGILSRERRQALEVLAEQALLARNGDARAVLTSLGAAPAVIETLVSGVGVAQDVTNGHSEAGAGVPLERPGQYTRSRELGRGSQSVVRAARDEIVGREVALKELVSDGDASRDGRSSGAARTRFLREVRLVAGLDHPGIVSVHELARRDDGTLFCAQKLIRGETLQARLAHCHSFDERLRLLRHVVDACQAMGFAHSKRVIHRDLKPSNIMVGEYGETVVVDWGLAKHQEESEEAVPLHPGSGEPGLTVAGTALGTPAYMSPEQARGDLPAIDARSDVFSLGAVLYQVLTGRPPFEGATSEHILEKVRAGEFPSVVSLAPDAPPELAAIAERALLLQPSGRYANAEELAQELSAYLAGGRVRAYQYRPWELLRRFASSHRALLTGAAIAVGALMLAAVVVAVRLHQTRLELASSFLERAYHAQQEGDWSKAAAYFSAARVQNDTAEERWGLAGASERIAERLLSVHGPADSLIDVGVLPDGTVIALGYSADRVDVREAESGKTLWTRSGEAILAAEFLPGGLVRLARPEGWTFHDAATGQELHRWPRASGYPCPGVFPPRVALLHGQLLRHEEGTPPRVVSTDVNRGVDRCAVSPDGHRAVHEDASGGLRLLSLEDGREIARRPFEAYRGLLFSPHGLVIFRQGRLEVLGGREGDFSIELPEARYGSTSVPPTAGGSALSPDGELAVIASRDGARQAVVLDLRSRSIRGVIHYPSGWPRLTFSLEGQRVFAAGMDNGSSLSGWRVPPDDTPRTPRWWMGGLLSKTGGAALLFDYSGRYEYFRPARTLVASGFQPIFFAARLVGDGPAAAFIPRDRSAVVLHDLKADRVLWNHPCRLCEDLSVSDDGSRVAQLGADGLEVWDTRSGRRLFQQARGALPFKTVCAISGEGRRLAWNLADTLFLHDLDSGQEVMVPFDGAGRLIRFGPDPGRLLVITTRSVALLEAKTGQAMWRVPNDATDILIEALWAPDGRRLVVTFGGITTEVLDANSGQRLASFQGLSRVVTPVLAELYAPDLREKAVAAATTWDIRPVPQPDETPAAEALARILQRTGLNFRGVELVAGP